MFSRNNYREKHFTFLYNECVYNLNSLMLSLNVWCDFFFFNQGILALFFLSISVNTQQKKFKKVSVKTYLYELLQEDTAYMYWCTFTWKLKHIIKPPSNNFLMGLLKSQAFLNGVHDGLFFLPFCRWGRCANISHSHRGSV